jgi:hypothetical protein
VALVVEPGWLILDDRDHGGEMGRALMPHRDQRDEVPVTTDVACPNHIDASQLSVLELEEATDADDIPWAQL